MSLFVKTMREKLDKFCDTKSCINCPLNTNEFTCGRGYSFLNDDKWRVSDAEVVHAYKTIFENDKNRSNPYWENITQLANKQREKGIKDYGQGIEDNSECVLTRIKYIQEELVDALMYLEWLKEGLCGKTDQTL